MVLVACILLSSGACFKFSSPPDGPHMSERVYERPDEEAANALVAEIIELSKSEGNIDLILEKYDQFFDEYFYKSSTLETIASINYDKNIYDEYWREENIWMAQYSGRIISKMLELEQGLFTSDYVDYFVEEYGQEYVDAILGSDPISDEELEIQATIARLESEYMPLLYNPSATEEEMANLLKQLVIARNTYAGMLTDADGNPFENYFDYAYEIRYGREYSPDEVVEYRQAMREHMVPLIQPMFGLYSQYHPRRMEKVETDGDSLLTFLPEIISNTIPEMMYSWDYMIERGLYDFELSQAKADTSYVTNFSEYGDAFMFINPEGYFQADLQTAIHEFGHYNEVFMHKRRLANVQAFSSYDLAETHSQALELLTLPAVEDICNKYYPSYPDLYKSYAINILFNSLWTMLFSCAVDSFEYTIYNADEDQLTAEFFSQTMQNEIDYYFPINMQTYTYPQIAHIFIYPGYYISYSVSMAFSYVVWASENNVENYVEVVEYGTSNLLSDVCKKTGLGYPLKPSVIEGTVAAIYECLAQTFA